MQWRTNQKYAAELGDIKDGRIIDMWLYKSTRVLMAKLTQIKFQKAQTACGIDCEIDCLTSGWLTIGHGPQCWYVGVRQLEKGGPCSNTSPQCKLYLVFDKSLKEAIYTLIIIPIVHKHITRANRHNRAVCL